MSANLSLMLLHEALCLLLLWSCYCRATRTNSNTHLAVLVSFWLLYVSALFATFAPVLIDWHPDAVSLLLLASITLVQTVTARFWRQSPPTAFQRQEDDDDDFLDSGRFTDPIPLTAQCPTTRPMKGEKNATH